MKLKDHPLNDTILNKRVWNIKKTSQGTIVSFNHNNLKDIEDFIVDIIWDNGGVSPAVPVVLVEIELV